MALPITLTSPLPPNDLLFESMVASEGLSLLGEMQLGLVSEKSDLKPEDLLGKPVTVSVNLRDDAKRHFHGYITRFGIGLSRGKYFGYRAVVRPWLWFLTRTADCRIFQEMTVPDIVKKVFGDHPSANFEFKLFRTYRTWNYCVQYRESDYNFIARLLEHEGIYWFMEHTDGDAKLVLVDSQSAHDAAPNYESIDYFEKSGGNTPDVECVSQWDFASEVETDKIELTSYDFERPSTSLKADAKKSMKYSLPDFEAFDFQGDYIVTADGTQWAEDRLDEQQSRFQIAHAASNSHGIEAGRLLKLLKHPRADQNDQYLVTSISIRASLGIYESGGGGQGGFDCDFVAIPAAQQFRPARQTPKPFVQGPQTAIVVGPGGEEIFTDKYGRVKVQFHWDREGAKNEKSSCWVRVSHPWAGKNFGAIHIPRMGQEVVVDFLEGDPDQPLITGRVYNAEQMPPWELPANATQSGILTRSSKGGSVANANALRFEDKKGSEQVWLHAEKNQDIEVENDETHWVGHDRTKTIDHDETSHIKHDRTETVDNNETITVHHDRVERVDNNEMISIGVNRTEKVGGNEIVTIVGDQTEGIQGSMSTTVSRTKSVTVGINSAETVGAAKELTVGGLYQVTVGLAHNTTVGASHSLQVGGGSSEAIGGAKSLTVGGNLSTSVGGTGSTQIKGDWTDSTEGKYEQTVKAEHIAKAKKFEITAEDELVITVGSAKLVMKKDGSILFDGKDINTKASGNVNIKASSDITLKGSSIKEN